jgi:hypothetical protein
MVTRVFLVGVCVSLGLVLASSSASSAGEGRWKLDDSGGCYFDAADEGPNQCTPPGRWKDDGNGGCYFDATDTGPDQCVPAGTEQAVPEQANLLQVATAETPVGGAREHAARAEQDRDIAADRGVAGDNR